MAEYIERDMFLKIISCKPSSPTTDREDRLINYCISAVKNFPAADVRPVAKARWKCVSIGRYACSYCGDEPYYSGDIHTLRFCPNCGATMIEDYLDEKGV